MNISKKAINSSFHKKNRGSRYTKDKRGFVLILMLMLISLMSVLAITSFELVTDTTKITGNHKRYLQALYTADAGIEHTVYVLKRADPWSITWGTQSTLQTLAMDTEDQGTNNWSWSGSPNYRWTLSNSDYSVTVTISSDSSVHKIFVESTGAESGFSKTIQAEIENSPVRITRWMEKEM